MYTLQIQSDNPNDISTIVCLAEIILKSDKAQLFPSDVREPLRSFCYRSSKFLEEHSGEILATEQWLDIAHALQNLASIIQRASD